MENENDTQEIEETEEASEVAEETSEETIDWEARAKELEQKAIKQREKTKELKAKLAEKEAPEPKEKSSDYKFNTGDKALLKSYKDIQGADELALAENWMKKYGGDIVDDMLNDEVFNAKLKVLRDAKAVKDAIPPATKRSAGSTNDKIDYWLDKYNQSGNLDEIPQELRSEVLNARLKSDEQKQMFGH